MQESIARNSYSNRYFEQPWFTILKEEHVFRQHRMVDEFKNDPEELIKEIRSVFDVGDYIAIFDWIEFVLKHPACPHNLHRRIETDLRCSRAAYRVIDKTIICPIGSDAEHATIVKAFADLQASQFNGARAHLRNAASKLTSGAFADSVRESIHAVESVCETLDPSAEFSKALAKLEQKISIHGGMKNGFKSLYGYSRMPARCSSPRRRRSSQRTAARALRRRRPTARRTSRPRGSSLVPFHAVQRVVVFLFGLVTDFFCHVQDCLHLGRQQGAMSSGVSVSKTDLQC